jgi:hypothetical protein
MKCTVFHVFATDTALTKFGAQIIDKENWGFSVCRCSSSVSPTQTAIVSTSYLFPSKRFDSAAAISSLTTKNLVLWREWHGWQPNGVNQDALRVIGPLPLTLQIGTLGHACPGLVRIEYGHRRSDFLGAPFTLHGSIRWCL